MADYWLKWKYGIDRSEFDALAAMQGGRCAICQETPSPTRQGKTLHIDHDHISGSVRGLLCHRCNLVLGHVDESVEVLRAAIEYLQRYKETVA